MLSKEKLHTVGKYWMLRGQNNSFFSFQTLPSNLLVCNLTDTLSGTNICKKDTNVVSAIVFSESINILVDPGTTNQAVRVGSINKTQIPVTQIITSSFKNLLNLVFHTSTLSFLKDKQRQANVLYTRHKQKSSSSERALSEGKNVPIRGEQPVLPPTWEEKRRV